MSGYGFDILTGGSISALDAITGYSDGDVAFGVIDGLHLVYQMDAASGATADGDLVVQPDDTTGNERWIKMVPGGAMTHVEAGCNNEQILTAGSSFIFEIEEEDVLSEYDNATGIFTAKYAGTYLVSCSFLTTSCSWPANTTCRIGIMKNGVISFGGNFIRIASSFSGTLNPKVSTSLKLEANDYIQFFMVHDTTGAGVAANTTYNRLTIDRII